MTRARTAVSVACLLCSALFVSLPQAQQPPDRSKPPALGPAPALDLPSIQKRALSNGLPVWIVEAHKVPLAQVNLVVMAGSNDDPAGKFGAANLTAAMLDEGAGARSALEIADAVDYLGAELVTTSSSDSSAVRLNVPVARLRDALPIMADVAIRPTFPVQDLERLRQERLTALIQARDDPAQIIPLAFQRVVFGAAHRYGTGQAGTEGTLKTFTADDLKTFHTAMYQPSNATLIVVGDITPDDAARRATALFGGWTRGTVPAVRYPTARASGATTVYLVDKPGAAQSSVRIGSIGVARSTSDYFALQVLNTILGGSFTSRLNNNLRETHAYTYGANSRFDMRRQAGPFAAGAEIVTAKTDSALVQFMKELAAIRDTIPTTELEKAKQYLQLQLPGDFETTGDIASQLVPVVVYGLPLDYYNGYVQSIGAITQADVQRVARQYLDPAKMAVVIVGDRKTIEPGIRALNLGTVVVRDATGKTIAP